MVDFPIWRIEAVVSAFCEILTNGWYLHFHKTYGHQNWTADTSKEVYSLGTNQATASDTITCISHDFEETPVKQEL